ncbi:MAG: hypothetical protein RR281_03360, partial [Pseudoflavonifractor sp.]
SVRLLAQKPIPTKIKKHSEQELVQNAASHSKCIPQLQRLGTSTIYALVRRLSSYFLSSVIFLYGDAPKNALTFVRTAEIMALSRQVR